jgi:phosphoglycerol transferase MdoB-like AlkP superfamily enzyme
MNVHTVKAGGLYFILVFAAGWVFGPIREFWLIPLVGQTAGLLFEAPFMLLVMIAACQWVIRRLRVPYALKTRAAIGLIALGLLVLAEAVGVRWIRRLSLAEYLARFSLISGSITLVSFLLYAAMPMLVNRNDEKGDD